LTTRGSQGAVTMPPTIDPAGALNVLAQAENLGICLSIQGDHIRYRGPMTAALRSEIRQHKTALQELLRGPTFAIRHDHSLIPLPAYKEWLWREIETGRLGIAYTNSPAWCARLQGEISVDILEKSVASLCERHSALRTRIFESDARLYMATDREPRLQVVDLGSDGPELEDALAKLRWTPFDPRVDAMFRPFLIRVGREDHVIGCVCHHFVADGTSLDILIEDWLAAYGSHLGVRDPGAGERPYQYIDYLFEMDRWYASAGLRHRLHYWKRTLSRALPSTLPADFPLARETYCPLSSSGIVSFDATDTQRLRATAVAIGVTPINFLLAVHAIAIARRSPVDEVTLRNVDHGRRNSGLLRMVGSTDNALCLRVALDPAEGFADFAQRVQDIHLEAQAQDTYWGLVFSILDEVGTSDAHAVVNVVDHGSTGTTAAPNPNMAALRSTAFSTPALLQSLRHHPPHTFSGGLGTSFHYHMKYLDGAYRRETIERFNDDYATITRAVMDDPRICVEKLRR
jgi:hypothetical protein